MPTTDTSTRGGAVSEDKRTLGAYYSPEPYARALVRWALNGQVGRVTDPSYGGCAMLRVAIDELAMLGASSPAELVFGADIDTSTAQWTAHLVSQGVPRGHLLSADFLSLTPGNELPLTPALVGNPPYVRHHRLSAAARGQAIAAADAAGITVSGRASLWAYFVVHATRFVTTGGRMALLLPGAATQADYAQKILNFVAERFEDVLVVRVRERIFVDAQEETVVLLAAGARSSSRPSHCDYADVDDLAGLEHLLLHRATKPLRAPANVYDNPSFDGIATWKQRLIPAACFNLLDNLFARDETRRLGDVARISLGTVTGGNATYVLTDEETDWLDVRAHTVPVVTRNASLIGPALPQTATASSARRLLTLSASFPLDRRTRLGRHLTAAEAAGVHERHHSRREPWWALGQVAIPDAFLPYTVSAPRGIALNKPGAASTNTVHQVQWRMAPSLQQQRAWALTSWSTLGRACAELFGRHYGGGVLKLELAAAGRLPVVDSLKVTASEWRACQYDGKLARQFADRALLAAGLDLTNQHLRLLQETSLQLAAVRSGQRRGPGLAGLDQFESPAS